jgi:putative transposase
MGWLGLCQQLYNSALQQRIDAYERCGKSVSEYDQSLELKILKNEFPEYKRVGSQVLKQVLKRLDLAYKAFFRRAKQGAGKAAGFPKFQSWRNYNSFTFTNSSGWRLDGRVFDIAYVGKFKMSKGGPIQGNIATVTVKRSPTRKWYVVFSCKDVPDHPLEPLGKSVGIDVGIAKFCADSDGVMVDNPKWYADAERRLRVLQRKLSRAKKGSNRREQVKLEVARLHEKIVNRRRDFVCKTARSYVNNNDTICLEALKITNMNKKPAPKSDDNGHFLPNGASAKSGLNKSIADAGWGLFNQKIDHAAEDAGRIVIRVDPKYTSQRCSSCGHISADNRKSQAVFVCKACGFNANADVNAAVNILNIGLSL